MCEMCMDAHHRIENPNVEDILRTEQETYELINTKFMEKIYYVDAPQPESGSNQHQKAISLP